MVTSDFKGIYLPASDSEGEGGHRCWVEAGPSCTALARTGAALAFALVEPGYVLLPGQG